jgi:hypothetical protein
MEWFNVQVTSPIIGSHVYKDYIRCLIATMQGRGTLVTAAIGRDLAPRMLANHTARNGIVDQEFTAEGGNYFSPPRILGCEYICFKFTITLVKGSILRLAVAFKSAYGITENRKQLVFYSFSFKNKYNFVKARFSILDT